MKQFKTFHRGTDTTTESILCKTAIEWANEWIEQNPEAEIIDFRHAVNASGYDVICILYEIPGENIPMIRHYDYFTNRTEYVCPKCDHRVTLDGNIVYMAGDDYCPMCKKGTRK